MTDALLVFAVSLTVLALLVFAVSVVVFLVRTSRHRPSRRWIAAAGASLVLLLVFGTLSNTVSRQSGLTLTGERDTPNIVGQAAYDATATVTRVVGGDTIDRDGLRLRLRVLLLKAAAPRRPV